MSEATDTGEGREWTEAYSPPPWRAEPADGRHANGIPIWRVVCDGFNDETPVICGSAPGWPLFEADAKFIAAAPDLLDACKFAFAAMNSEEGRARAKAALVAAVAKAEGRS